MILITLVGERLFIHLKYLFLLYLIKGNQAFYCELHAKARLVGAVNVLFITRLNRSKYFKLSRVEMTNFSLLHADKNVLLSSPNILLTVVVSIHKRHWLKSWCGFCGETVIYQGLLTEALCWATKKDNCAALLLKAPLWENLPRPRLPPNSLTPPPVSCVFRLQSLGMMAPVSVE